MTLSSRLWKSILKKGVIRALRKKRSKYRRCYPYDAEEAPFIEEGIRPLIIALSQWDHIKVMYSCEGHPEAPVFNIPYVTFKAEVRSKAAENIVSGIVSELKRRIKNTGWGIFYGDDRGFIEEDRMGREQVRVDYTIRPYKRRKLKTQVNDIAKLVCLKNPQYVGVVYYHD